MSRLLSVLGRFDRYLFLRPALGSGGEAAGGVGGDVGEELGFAQGPLAEESLLDALGMRLR